MHSADLATTIEDLPGGGCLVSLAINSVVDFEDTALFVLREGRDMLNNPTDPIFETVATPCLLAEYPAGAAEWPGGFLRVAQVSVKLDNRTEVTAFLGKITDRLTSLGKYMDVITDENRLQAETVTVLNHPVTFQWTATSIPFKRMVITLQAGDEQLVMRDGGLMGALFVDVCPFQDVSPWGTVPWTDECWRANEVTLTTYASCVDLIKQAVVTRLGA